MDTGYSRTVLLTPLGHVHPDLQESKHQHSRALHTSAYGTSATVPLAKASPMANPRFKGWRNGPYLYGKEMQSHLACVQGSEDSVAIFAICDRPHDTQSWRWVTVLFFGQKTCPPGNHKPCHLCHEAFPPRWLVLCRS